MEENQEVTAQVVEQETPSAQEAEAQVLEQAAEQGEIAPEAAGIETAEDGTIRINLDQLNQQEDAVQERETEEVSVGERTPDSEEVVEEVRVESDETESPILEVVEEQPTEVEQPVQEVQPEPEPVQETPKVELPENVDKLVKFMEETGGSLEDYVNLNKDVSKMDPVSTIREYYKQKYPHYDAARIDRKMNKAFLFDQEVDDPDVIQEKKDAFQDELFAAQNYLNEQKAKYYDELKLGSKLTPEAQEAMKIASEYKAAQENQNRINQNFLQATDKVFNNDFKGFDFKVGDKTYRYKADGAKVKESQKNLDNFLGKYIGEDGSMKDATGYHKAIFAAENIDKIAQHFYEQGRAEAIKNAAKEANNINMNPRQDASAVTTPSGSNVRVVSGESMDKLRIKWNK